MKPTRQLHRVAPVFLVHDVVKASAYYRDVLGFAFDKIWGVPPAFCMPERDDLIVMLQEVKTVDGVLPNCVRMGDPTSWDAYFWVADADALFAEFQSRHAQVVYSPVDKTEYGNREFAVSDLDGYVLAFAHDLEAVGRR